MSTASAAGTGKIPTLTWAEYHWEGTIALPEWDAFNQARGAWQAVQAATNARRRKRGRIRRPAARCIRPR